MTTFLLVHGAWHGAWCWDRLVPLLTDAGCRSVAVDLPTTDPTAGYRAYVDEVRLALPEGDDVVLVGHSLGGLTVTAAARELEVSEVVYLCAMVADPGKAMADSVHPDTFTPAWSSLSAHQVSGDRGVTSWPAGPAIDAFYGDCSAEDAQWAAGRLRPQAWGVFDEVMPEPRPVPARWLLTTGDRVLAREGQLRMAALVGAVPTEIPGDHSPFLSHPERLARWLVGR